MEQNMRKSNRLDVCDLGIRVSFTETESTSIKGIGVCRDLCREGLQISSAEFLQKGAVLDIKIVVPDDSESFISSALVVWSRIAKDPAQGYKHGVQLLNMNTDDRYRLLNHAYRHWLKIKIN